MIVMAESLEPARCCSHELENSYYQKVLEKKPVFYFDPCIILSLLVA